MSQLRNGQIVSPLLGEGSGVRLFIFNPENDMALADGKPGYTPPAQIQQMRRELWWLPEWWAEEGDIVWNGEDPLSLPDDTKIMPWGFTISVFFPSPFNWLKTF